MNNDLLRIKICKLFYQCGLSKVEIGERFRMSRFKVAKILDEAIDRGNVKIIIHEPDNTALEIEAALEKRYNLFRAFVVETCKDYERTKKNVGRAAAQVLFDFLNDGDVIGIAWGTTLFHLVNSLSHNRNKKS